MESASNMLLSEAMADSSSSSKGLGSGAGEVSTPRLLQRQPLSSSRFKGVVPQPNGRWGAQIYDRHARVWLGTFPDEDAAARAYDVAARRYRGREAVLNFPAERAPDGELAFLAAHSKSEVVDMLRKHTYADELHQNLRRGVGVRARPTPAWAREQLFEKIVTPSDVGKLNRLVVPKHHAEKHLPRKRDAATTGKGVLLNLEDGEGKVWRFRYSYWNSSQSYVLTKGWRSFVREKGIRAGDTVAFYRSPYGPEKQLLIGYRKMQETQDEAASEAGAAEIRVVKLFGADIATENKATSSEGHDKFMLR